MGSIAVGWKSLAGQNLAGVYIFTTEIVDDPEELKRYRLVGNPSRFPLLCRDLDTTLRLYRLPNGCLV